MLSRLGIFVALALALASPAPAWAWFPHGSGGGGGGGTSPVVTAGATQPTLNTTSGLISASYNTITPTSHGSAGDYGYAIRGGVRWDTIPFQEVGRPGVSGTKRFGFFAWHVPTTTDMAAGLDSNISSAKVRCDSGSWFTITGPSTNPDAGGATDWNFTVTTGAGWADGLHKCDLVISPATGPDIIAEGPASDPYGTGLEEFKLWQAMISDGTGANPGTVMTVFPMQQFSNDVTILSWRGAPNNNNAVAAGQSVSMMGAAPNTFVSSLGTGTGRAGTYNVTGGSQLAAGARFTGSISGTTLTVSAMTSGQLAINNFVLGAGVTAAQIQGSGEANSFLCTPACTGFHGTGTYALAGTTQTVSSTTMATSAPAMMNVARSLYFFTNYNGTLSRAISYVSLSGSDANSGTDYLHPVLTIGKAAAVVSANGTSSGIYGGVVCLMNGSTYAYSGTVGPPRGIAGQLVYQSANQAPCNAPGDVGGATMDHTSGTPRQHFAQHTTWRYVNFLGVPDDGNGAAGEYLSVDHVTQVHDPLDRGGLVSNGAAYCFDSTSWFGQDGVCSSAILNRGNSVKYFPADGNHDVNAAVNNTFEYGGNIFKWATGTTTAGSNVITNVTIIPAELSGYTISSIFTGIGTATNDSMNVIVPGTEGGGGSQCLSGSYPLKVTAIDDTLHTITVLDSTGAAPTAINCTNAKLEVDGAHSDLFQVSVGNPFGDLLVTGNSWGANFPGYQQGEFLETAQMSGAYIANNYWGTDSTVTAHGANTKGGNENVINSHNTYPGGSGVTWNIQQSDIGDTLVQDQCPGTSWSVVTAGVNQRSKAAASNACYTTLP